MCQENFVPVMTAKRWVTELIIDRYPVIYRKIASSRLEGKLVYLQVSELVSELLDVQEWELAYSQLLTFRATSGRPGNQSYCRARMDPAEPSG